MRSLKSRIALTVAGVVLTFVTLAGPALASRADGICGGLGTWNPVTHQCE